MEEGLAVRYVQVNSVPYGSTGSLMLKRHAELVAEGCESWAMWGRGRAAQAPGEFNYGSPAGVALDVAATRMDGRAGFHSQAATLRLLDKLEQLDPDVVHLHNLHGYHVNVRMLFAWLAERRQRTVWTLHDCWAFTGHCAYFVRAGCNRWKNGTCGTSCPQLDRYPATMAKSSVAWNYAHKREAFTSLSPELLTLQVPSRWLANLVGESFLAGYPCEVHPHEVDTAVFHPTESTFRARHGLGDRPLVLGVAAPWEPRKGYEDFLQLRELLPAEYAIAMVGLSARQIRALPEGIVGVPRVDVAELAGIYSTADVLFQPSREETFGLTIAEARACGTPAVVYAGGGCAETAAACGGTVVAGLCEAAAAICELCGGGAA